MTDLESTTYWITFNKDKAKFEYRKEKFHVAYGDWVCFKVIKK